MQPLETESFWCITELQVRGDKISVLQVRRGKKDNFPYYSFKRLCCNPSLELSHRDGSDEGSQHMFSVRNKRNYL